MNKLGKQETLYETIKPGAKNYSQVLNKLKQANIGMIYFGGYHTEAGIISRQARTTGLNATLMSGDALMTNEYWTIAGPAGEGTLMTFSPDPARSPESKSVVDKFMKQGWRPEGYTLYAYGAAQRGGSVKAADVAKVLKGGRRFDTVLGKISFDSNGDVTVPSYVVYKWNNGKYDYVKN